jgi:hypothetical protein
MGNGEFAFIEQRDDTGKLLISGGLVASIKHALLTLYSLCNVIICPQAADRHENKIDIVQWFNKTAGLSHR